MSVRRWAQGWAGINGTGWDRGNAWHQIQSPDRVWKGCRTGPAHADFLGLIG